MKKTLLIISMLFNISMLKAQEIIKVEMDEAVIAARKFPWAIQLIANQVSVISAKEIAQANQPNTADLLQNSGQVLVQKSQQGGGSPIMRGFEANKILLVVDGVRMNNAIYRAGHLQNSITIDQFSLEKIEIVNGPGSVLYGSDALGGVIHFYTKSPEFSNSKKILVKGNVASRYATTNNEITNQVSLSVANNKWGSYTSYAQSTFGDLRQGANRSDAIGDLGKRNFYQGRINGKDTMLVNDNPNIQKGSAYQQYDLIQKLVWKQNKNVNHVVNFQLSNSSNVPRYDRLTEINSSGILKNAEWYYGPQNRLLLSYQAQLKNGKYYDEGNITLSHQAIEESRHNRGWNKTSLNHRNENVMVNAINLDFQKKYKDRFIRYGLESNFNEVTSTANAENIITGGRSALDTRYPDGGSSTRSHAVYLSEERSFGKLVIYEGIRYTNSQLRATFNDQTFFPFPFKEITQKNESLVADVSACYRTNNNWKFSFLFSSGFRTPNLDDLAKVFESTKGDTSGNNSTIGTLIVPNKDLKPEFANNYELGFSKKWPVAQFKVNTFFTDLTNAIVTQNSTFNGSSTILYGDTLCNVQQNVNVGKAYIYGISANIEHQLIAGFSFAANVNYTKGMITTNEIASPLDHISPVFGKASLNYLNQKWSASFYTLFNGAKKLKDYNVAGEDNLIYATANGLPSWHTLNLRANYNVNKNIDLQMAIENITDKNYRVFGSGISASGRNVLFAIKGNF
jgi:hemoglobin/transferrin/lactoferrin receptor protein